MRSKTALAGLMASITMCGAQSVESQPPAPRRNAPSERQAQASSTQSAEDRSADPTAIQANLVSFEEAYNAHDARAIAALFTENGHIIDKEGNQSEGREAIAKVFANIFAATPENRIEVYVDSIEFLGSNLAVEVGTTKELPTEGEPPTYDRYTVLHVKRDGKWQMALARDEEGPPPTGYERLQPLAWLVGEWIDNDGSSVVASTCRWSDDGNFLLQEFQLQLHGDEAMNVVTVPIDSAYAAPAETIGTTSELPPSISQNAIDTSDQARRQFIEGQYESALQLTDSAIREMLRDAVLHEFRSLVLFALQRFSESAAAIHAVLDVGPGWDWKTLSGLYASTDVYTTQLRALESACESSPDEASLLFLLGYQYLTCGHQEAAIRMFRRASELQPNDTVAAALVASLSPRDAQSSPPLSASDTPQPVPQTDVVGHWTATGAESSTYAMTLREDGTFTWLFERGVRTQKADGVYTVEGNVLAMEPDSGGVMLAELNMKGPNDLHFKMIGGASDDPGLEFRRSSSK